MRDNDIDLESDELGDDLGRVTRSPRRRGREASRTSRARAPWRRHSYVITAEVFNAWPYHAGRWSHTPDLPDDARLIGINCWVFGVMHLMTRHRPRHMPVLRDGKLVRETSEGDVQAAVSHDFLHRHRRDSLAIARKRVNNFTFGNDTKNYLSAFAEAINWLEVSFGIQGGE